MTDETRALQASVTAILRALKIAETQVQMAHRAYSFVPADIQTLRFVAVHPGSMLSDLAQHLGVVPTTASSIVDRLVERGLLLRERPETNRRAIALRLSGAGEEAFGRIDAEELETMQIMLDALPKSDRPAFLQAMERIARHVSNE